MNKRLYDVCIAGGGIGGIALALRLKLINKNISIYLAEKDTHFNQRSQGYGLTLQQANKVLSQLNIRDKVQSIDTPNDAHYTYNKDGELVSVFGRFRLNEKERIENEQVEALTDSTSEINVQEVKRPKVSEQKRAKQLKWEQEKLKRNKEKRYNWHLPRQKLREFLLDELCSIDSEVINWDRRVSDFTIDSTCDQAHNQLTIKFLDLNNNSSIIEARCLVGADGIFSKVRQLLYEKEMTSLVNNELKSLDCLVTLGMAPCESKVSLNSTFQTLHNENRFFSMPFTVNPNVTFWQFSFPCDKTNADKLKNNKTLLRKEIKSRLKDWHRPIPELIDATNDEMMTGTPVYDRDLCFGGCPEEKIILIGDAAHPMSPFKGQGANQALLDAVELSDVIKNYLADEHQKTEGFETFTTKMVKRSQSKMDGSRLRVYQYHDPKRQTELTESRGLKISSRASFNKEWVNVSVGDSKIFKDSGIDFRSVEDGTVKEKILRALNI